MPRFCLLVLFLVGVLAAVGCIETAEEEVPDAPSLVFEEPEQREDTGDDTLFTEPCIDLESILDFGPSPVGRASRQQVRIANCDVLNPLVIESLNITGPGQEAFELDTGHLTDEVGQIAIDRRSEVYLSISFEPRAEQVHEALLIIGLSGAQGFHEIAVRGQGVDGTCPSGGAHGRVQGTEPYVVHVSAEGLNTVEFAPQADLDTLEPTFRFEWSLVERPRDSQAVLDPDPTSPEPTLFLDLAGRYIVELRLIDDRGIASCEPARVFVQTITPSDIYIELTWYNPTVGTPGEGRGTDMDLHYLHRLGRWDQVPYDVMWRNRRQNWGTQANPSDVSLDIDDVSGLRPEIISHTNPHDLTYAVGVYYYSDSGFGPSYATVRIYIHDVLRAEFKDRLLPGAGTFWYVGDIEWPSGNIIARDEITQGFPQ